MKLLIVGATRQELGGVYTHFNLSDEDFVSYPGFDILITGVGMTATAFALGRYLNTDYSLVLNVGIAGSFDPDIELGSLVNISYDTIAEFGAEDHDEFISIDELGFGKATFSAGHDFTGLPNVKGITVNKVHGNANSIKIIKERFSPQTESMEGAAVFYACAQLNIPCFQVRSISNLVTPRAKETWKIGLAIKNLNDWLIGYLIRECDN